MTTEEKQLRNCRPEYRNTTVRRPKGYFTSAYSGPWDSRKIEFPSGTQYIAAASGWRRVKYGQGE